MKKMGLILGGVIVLLAASVTETAAKRNVIYGCVSRFGTHMRFVKKPKQCRWWEARIRLNLDKLKGPAGKEGPKGPQGPQGPQGEMGPMGPQGPASTCDPCNQAPKDQICDDGTFVIGFDSDGEIICSDPGARTEATCPYTFEPGADLRRCDLTNADLRDMDLRGVDLRNVDLSGAVLSGSILSDAFLSGANLSNAELIGTDLKNADLTNANLNGATLIDADLSGADLCGTTTEETDFEAVIWIDAVCPDCKNSSEQFRGICW